MMVENKLKIAMIIIFTIAIILCGYYYQKSSHVIMIGNQPGWCENNGDFHAFIYDAYGKGEYKGNWSQIKNFLVYQHNKYSVDFIIDSPTFGSGRTDDIRYSLDEYIIMKDKQCGNGTPLHYGLDILDPGLNSVVSKPTIVPTMMATYDYLNSQFGKVLV
ncbi:MAG: hypothetical protein WC415_01620 [Patescibacteria group bacterium]